MPGLIGIGQAYKQAALSSVMESNQREGEIWREKQAQKQAEEAGRLQLIGLGTSFGGMAGKANGAEGGSWNGGTGALAGAALAAAFGQVL